MELEYLAIPLPTARLAVPRGEYPNTVFITFTRRKRCGYITQAMIDDAVFEDYWQSYMYSETLRQARLAGWACAPGPLEFRLQPRQDFAETDPENEMRAFCFVGWYYPIEQAEKL